MATLRETMSPQDLAMHDAGELLPQSAQLIAEDRESGRLILSTADKTKNALSEDSDQ